MSCTSAPKPAAAAPVPTAKEQFLISPITGERIPASKITEHMRYGMWSYYISSLLLVCS